MSEEAKAESGAGNEANTSTGNASDGEGAGAREASSSSESAGGNDGSTGGESSSSEVTQTADTKSVQLTEAQRRSASAKSLLAFNPSDIKPEVRAAAAQSGGAKVDANENANE